VLGSIEVSMPPGRQLRPPERRLLEDFTAQAGLAFRNLRLDAELRARVEQLARQSADLAESRRRLLAARDDERQRIAAVIERESHLRPIPATVSTLDVGDVDAEQRLQQLEAATGAGLEALREVTRDLYPLTLTRHGLASALRAHLERRGRPEVLSVAPALNGLRFNDQTEAAAYFCAVELTAQLGEAARSPRLELTVEDGCLVLRATGGASGLETTQSAIFDRVEAAGGRVWSRRDPDGRVDVQVDLPVRADYAAADAHAAASRSVPNADFAR
jgi:hypothetical protein